MGDSYADEQPVDASYLTGDAKLPCATISEADVWVHPLPQFSSIPPLPRYDSVFPDDYLGPTEESNWVMPGRILVGAYPSSLDDTLNDEILTSILRLGITTFVCLQEEYQHQGVTEFQWRNGYKLRPYIYDAVQLLDNISEWPGPSPKPEGLEFVHFPIVDCATVSDARVLRLCKDLVKRLVKGENMYIHCWGGHGRTGTVVSVMLGLIFNLGAKDAMQFCQFCHDMRACPMGVPSPQTDEQRQQVSRIIQTVLARRRRHAEAKARASRSPRRRVSSPRAERPPSSRPRSGSASRRGSTEHGGVASPTTRTSRSRGSVTYDLDGRPRSGSPTSRQTPRSHAGGAGIRAGASAGAGAGASASGSPGGRVSLPAPTSLPSAQKRASLSARGRDPAPRHTPGRPTPPSHGGAGGKPRADPSVPVPPAGHPGRRAAPPKRGHNVHRRLSSGSSGSGDRGAGHSPTTSAPDGITGSRIGSYGFSRHSAPSPTPPGPSSGSHVQWRRHTTTAADIPAGNGSGVASGRRETIAAPRALRGRDSSPSARRHLAAPSSAGAARSKSHSRPVASSDVPAKTTPQTSTQPSSTSHGPAPVLVASSSGGRSLKPPSVVRDGDVTGAQTAAPSAGEHGKTAVPHRVEGASASAPTASPASGSAGVPSAAAQRMARPRSGPAARRPIASSTGGRSIRPPVGPSLNVAGTVDAKPAPTHQAPSHVHLNPSPHAPIELHAPSPAHRRQLPAEGARQSNPSPLSPSGPKPLSLETPSLSLPSAPSTTAAGAGLADASAAVSPGGSNLTPTRASKPYRAAGQPPSVSMLLSSRQNARPSGPPGPGSPARAWGDQAASGSAASPIRYAKPSAAASAMPQSSPMRSWASPKGKRVTPRRTTPSNTSQQAPKEADPSGSDSSSAGSASSTDRNPRPVHRPAASSRSGPGPTASPGSKSSGKADSVRNAAPVATATPAPSTPTAPRRGPQYHRPSPVPVALT